MKIPPFRGGLEEEVENVWTAEGIGDIFLLERDPSKIFKERQFLTRLENNRNIQVDLVKVCSLVGIYYVVPCALGHQISHSLNELNESVVNQM
jgi:hypothetical protein